MICFTTQNKYKYFRKKYQSKLIKIASKAKLTAFDFNYRKNLHTNKIETQNLFKEINQFVDINFISYDDMIDIFGKTDAIDFVKKILERIISFF